MLFLRVVLLTTCARLNACMGISALGHTGLEAAAHRHIYAQPFQRFFCIPFYAQASNQTHPAFFDAMASSCSSAEEAAYFSSLLRDAFAAFCSFDFAHPEAHDGALARLDIITQGGAMRRCLASTMLHEAAMLAMGPTRRTGKQLEAASALAPLLAASPLFRIGGRWVVPPTLPVKACFVAARGYPKNRSTARSEIGSIRRAMERLHATAHEVLRRAALVKSTGPEDALNGREAVPAWLACVAGGNWCRSEAGSYIERVLYHPNVFDSSSEGFACGAAAVALRLCRPFLASAEKKEGALRHLDPTFYVSHRHRLAAFETERALGGGNVSSPPSSPALFLYVSPEAGAAAAPHFIAESFFAAQRLVRTGLVPCVLRYQSMVRLMRNKTKAAETGSDDEDDDGPLEDGARG
jgi:hypothetical protein